jgi:hypothetical protein
MGLRGRMKLYGKLGSSISSLHDRLVIILFITTATAIGEVIF